MSHNGAHAALHTLTVINGSGSGSYEESTVVHIWANPYEDTNPERTSDEPLNPSEPCRIFDKWTGDTAYLVAPNTVHTTLVMPNANIIVTAQYKDAPHWGPPRVISYFPTAHKGVIFIFHGRGGYAASLVHNTEYRIFINDAISHGYGVVVPDSFDRKDGGWNETASPADNIDLQRVAELRHELIRQGEMNPTDPVYLLGISNGGVFASLFDSQTQQSLGFPVVAAALYVSSGNVSVIQNTTVPTFFALAKNDSIGGQGDQNINVMALLAFCYLFNRGIPTQYWVNPASPVYPERFWRVEGLSQQDSEAIYTALKSAGFLDENDFQRENPLTSGWEVVIPAEYGSFMYDIQGQLVVAYAEHQFMSDFNHKVFSFFDNPTTIVEQVPVIDNFSPGAGPPGTLVTINGDNFIAITEVTFNGVPADFTVRSMNQVQATVPPGAATGPIEVRNPAGTATSAIDFYLSAPQIISFTPESGTAGTVVTITGNGFVDITAVMFNGTQATIIGQFPTTLIVPVPNGATTGPIAVENYLGIGLSPTDFVVPGPTISSLNPGSGPVGTLVIIGGTGFSDVVEVRFNGVAAPILSHSSTQISTQVPEGATTGPIKVIAPSGTATSATDFIVLAPPTINSFTPSSGRPGTEVTIGGTHLNGATNVSFAGTSAAFTVDSEFQIRTTVPPGAKSGRIQVTTPEGTATSSGFFRVLR